MKIKQAKKVLFPLLTLLTVFTVSCSSGTGDSGSSGDSGSTQNSRTSGTQESDESGTSEDESSQDSGQDESVNASLPEIVTKYGSFAEAHDAFKTTLARQDNDDYTIPEPPKGLFDLVSYPSKVGDLAAYVSSDPGDGQKHPLIIWVVGGWGNGIDDFPWVYPEWDNDQTGSAFWQAGVLTMYPSFRGGSGNPGYYEALYGEVDDIVSAYEYAASLPYVDPDRIYLGGHSTGGTRALLASEYTDKFRAVFCFGAVDEIKYHNNSQFTFDTNIEEEFIMRSPIYWLENVKSPTFLIEGIDGNSANLKNIQNTSQNDNIHCYVIDNADHFAVLAPITPVLAQKILADTGEEVNISITQEELDAAMKQDPVVPLPAMTQWTIDDINVTFACPYTWDVMDTSTEEEFQMDAYSHYEGENVWDLATLFMNAYVVEGDDFLQTVAESLRTDEGYEVTETTLNGFPAIDAQGISADTSGTDYYNRFVAIQNGEICVSFDFYIHSSLGEEAEPLFQSMIESIGFVQQP